MRAAAALAVLFALVLTGCTATQEDPGLLPGGVGESDVDVDTPGLRKAKAELGMDDCPATGSQSRQDSGSSEGSEDSADSEDGLPDLTLPCLGGGRDVEMSSLRGPLVINLWQSFCGPCREEMPALQAFHEQHGDEVPVLGVDYQDTRPAAALDLAAETGATYASVADPGGELTGVGAFPTVRGLPMWVLVDEGGAIVHVEAGGVTEPEEIEVMVGEHLGVDL